MVAWSELGNNESAFCIGIAYLDPGNLESQLQAGAQAGYTLMWVLMWVIIMVRLPQRLMPFSCPNCKNTVCACCCRCPVQHASLTCGTQSAMIACVLWLALGRAT